MKLHDSMFQLSVFCCTKFKLSGRFPRCTQPKSGRRKEDQNRPKKMPQRSPDLALCPTPCSLAPKLKARHSVSRIQQQKINLVFPRSYSMLCFNFKWSLGLTQSLWKPLIQEHTLNHNRNHYGNKAYSLFNGFRKLWVLHMYLCGLSKEATGGRNAICTAVLILRGAAGYLLGQCRSHVGARLKTEATHRKYWSLPKLLFLNSGSHTTIRPPIQGPLFLSPLII